MKKGYLSVGDGHTIYFEDWGNPKAVPIFALHGGPGTGFSKRHQKLFDPKKHRVIFHDQRGCGRSTPFASTKHNTTQDLIADIEKLREHLGIKKMYVAGGSWGSTLALFYAIAHPSRVKKLLIWSVWLARKFDTYFMAEGYPRHFFPAEWERFISVVPKQHRKNGESITRYYAAKIRSSSKQVASSYADLWAQWEGTLISINYNPKTLAADTRALSGESIPVSILETHYFLNHCFVPENYILANINKIKHIPCFVAHGYFDMCTPAVGAYDLAKAYGKKLKLMWTNSSHTTADPEMFKTLSAATRGELI
ncbi:MAG: prolyl aminopeptidase [Patescibacteria group bacterium]